MVAHGCGGKEASASIAASWAPLCYVYCPDRLMNARAFEKLLGDNAVRADQFEIPQAGAILSPVQLGML